MSLNFFSILIIVWVLALTECQNFCELIRPNNEYKGLGIYHHYLANGSDAYIMYNKAGHQWSFIINRKGKKSSDWTIQMANNSMVRVKDTNLITRFGIFHNEKSYDCRVMKSGVSQTFECDVWTRDGTKTYLGPFIKQYSPKLLIFEPYPKLHYPNENLMIITKEDPRQLYLFDPIKGDDEQCSKKGVMCGKLKFVDQMNTSLFSKIDAIVDFNYDQSYLSSGHLLLFSIDGRPHYCFNFENRLECNSGNDLKPLLEDCFRAPPSTDYSRVLTIVISVVIVLLIAAILLVLFWRFCCGEKPVGTNKTKITDDDGKSLRHLKYSSSLPNKTGHKSPKKTPQTSGQKSPQKTPQTSGQKSPQKTPQTSGQKSPQKTPQKTDSESVRSIEMVTNTPKSKSKT